MDSDYTPTPLGPWAEIALCALPTIGLGLLALCALWIAL